MDDKEYRKQKNKGLTDTEILQNTIMELSENLWTAWEPYTYNPHNHKEGTTLVESIMWLTFEVIESRRKLSEEMRVLTHNIRQLQPFEKG